MGILFLSRRRIIKSSWAGWNEQLESGLGLDQDRNGQEDTFVCFMENPAVGGNETGVGVLSGADLVATQTGNVAGATGLPPSRKFETSDWLTITKTCAEITKSTSWTVILKFHTFNDAEGDLIYFSDNAANPVLRIYNVSNAIKGNVNNTWGDGFTNAMPTTGDVYVAMQADGINPVIYGWDTSKITKWSSVPAAQKDVITGELGDTTGLTYHAADHFICTMTDASNAAFQITGYLYYFILSKVALIDA